MAARAVVILLVASGVAVAQSWTGALVDAHCYAAKERNVNPTDTLTAVDRDRGQEIRYCSPKPDTKTFALVERDATSFNLDPGGNTKAVELVRKIGRRPLFLVTVTGELDGRTIKVDTIEAGEVDAARALPVSRRWPHSDSSARSEASLLGAGQVVEIRQVPRLPCVG